MPVSVSRRERKEEWQNRIGEVMVDEVVGTLLVCAFLRASVLYQPVLEGTLSFLPSPRFGRPPIFPLTGAITGKRHRPFHCCSGTPSTRV